MCSLHCIALPPRFATPDSLKFPPTHSRSLPRGHDTTMWSILHPRYLVIASARKISPYHQTISHPFTLHLIMIYKASWCKNAQLHSTVYCTQSDQTVNCKTRFFLLNFFALKLWVNNTVQGIHSASDDINCNFPLWQTLLHFTYYSHCNGMAS